MALGSVYFSLNISTTMPFKDVLKWIFVARFFCRPLCFDANRDWQEGIWYESSPPSNDLIHVCIFLASPSSLKTLTMMSSIKNLSYSFAEASPSFAPNIIIAMVVRPWVPTYYNCNGCTGMGSQQGGCMAMDFKYYNCHTIAMARVPRSDSRPSQPPGMSSSSICDSTASATATYIRNSDYI